MKKRDGIDPGKQDSGASVEEYSIRDRYEQQQAFMEKIRKEIEPTLPDFMKLTATEIWNLPKDEQDVIHQKRREWEAEQREAYRKAHRWTDEDRLKYYREHGLTCCDDYPGGDTQFESDVLSGEFHARVITDQPMMREDQYVHDKILDGTLKCTMDLVRHLHHPVLKLAFFDMGATNGTPLLQESSDVRHRYHGNLGLYREEVLSGEYARRVMSGFDFDQRWCVGIYPPNVPFHGPK